MVRAWSRQPVGGRVKPHGESLDTRVEKPTDSSPIDIHKHRRFEIARAWPLPNDRRSNKATSTIHPRTHVKANGLVPNRNTRKTMRYNHAGMVPPTDRLSSATTFRIALHTHGEAHRPLPNRHTKTSTIFVCAGMVPATDRQSS